MMRGLLLALVMVWPLAASATTVRFRTEAEMTRGAAAIVHAKVVARRSYVHASGVIVTEVTLEVSDTLKGPQAKELRFVQLGGTVAGRTQRVPGASTYTVGEEVVVFLTKQAGDWVELGVGAGKYAVWRDNRGAQVQRRLGGAAFARVVGKRTEMVDAPDVAVPEPLENFMVRVRKAVQP